MSGISSIGSSSLPNGGLSAVGASLLNSGQAPNAIPPSSASSTSSPSSTADTYQKQYAAFEQYNEQELLYASFLSPQDGLANADSVLEQAAKLLGTPGNPGTLGQSAPTAGSSASSPSSASSTSSPSSGSTALPNLPSVASILAASDSEAQQTLNAFANAPVGSSIVDFQA